MPGIVLFRISSVQVSIGEPQTHLPSMPYAFFPFSILKWPLIPQAEPQEFLAFQYFVLFSSIPQP